MAAAWLAADWLAFGGPPARNLVVQGRELLLIRGTTRTTIKRLPAECEFQGFGFLDRESVFFAYLTPTAGATSVLAVYDLGRSSESVLYELGGTGDSEFVVSPFGAAVAFQWVDGIYVFSLSGALAELRSGRFDHKGFEKRLVRVAKCEACEGLVWVGGARIKYKAWDGTRWNEAEAVLNSHFEGE